MLILRYVTANKHRLHALRTMEQVISQPGALLMLLGLLDPRRGFYTRFASLQLMATLVEHRGHEVQEHVLVAPGGCGAVLQCLDAAPKSSMEIIRNEALLLMPQLVSGSSDIQKLIAFEGAFERLLDIIAQEGRIEGGIVAQDALESLDALLLYNVSNQNYFRETLSIPMLAPLLFYPPPLPPNAPEAAIHEYKAQQNAFLLQEWDEQKLMNALVLFRVVRRLVDGQGEGHRANQLALRNSGMTECTAQLALASLAPPLLKAHALSLLSLLVRGSRQNQDLLSQIVVSPVAIMQGQATEGVPAPAQLSWQPPQMAILALITLALRGLSGVPQRELSLSVRLAALATLEDLVDQNVDVRMLILEALVAIPPKDAPTHNHLLLDTIAYIPDGVGSNAQFDPFQYVIASAILCALVRGSDTTKEYLHNVIIGPDGHCTTASPQEGDGDEPTLLVQQVIGNIAMGMRSLGDSIRKERAGELVKGNSATDWTRVIVAYLVLLAEWLWQSPLSVGDLLAESANVHVLVQPAAQSLGVDPLVQSLAVFVLGTAYEFNTLEEDEGVLNRAALHSILNSRIGPDQFGVRLVRLKSDTRFTHVEPDALDIVLRRAATAPQESEKETEDPLSLWFSWAFVEFWKENYVRVQKSILVDPSASSASQLAVPAELHDARQQVATLQGELVAAERDARKAELENGELRERIAALMSEKEALSEPTQFDALTSRCATLEEERTKLVSRVSELERERTELAGRVTALMEERTELASRVTIFESEQSELTARIAAFERGHSENNASQIEIETLRAKVASLESGAAELEALRTKIASLESGTAELEALRTKIASLEIGAAEVEGLRARVASQESDAAEIESLRAELATEKSRSAELQNRLVADTSKQELATVRMENEDLLVLLDDLSMKRKDDKARMRASGWEVSDDDDDDDDNDDNAA